VSRGFIDYGCRVVAALPALEIPRRELDTALSIEPGEHVPDFAARICKRELVHLNCAISSEGKPGYS